VNAPGRHSAGLSRALLRAKGEHTALLDTGNALRHALRDSKTGAGLASSLDSRHIPYVLALAGDADLGVRGLAKVGMARAAKMVADRVAKGRLPPDATGLQALLEDGDLGAAEQRLAASTAWALLGHADYCAAEATPAALSAIESTMLDRSGLGQLEDINKRLFHETPINLAMALAGEDY
jgi:hypothetical protein